MMATIGFSRKSMSNETMQAWASPALAYGFSKAAASNPPVRADKSFVNTCSSTTGGYNTYFCRYWANSVNGFYDSSDQGYVLPFVEF